MKIQIIDAEISSSLWHGCVSLLKFWSMELNLGIHSDIDWDFGSQKVLGILISITLYLWLCYIPFFPRSGVSNSTSQIRHSQRRSRHFSCHHAYPLCPRIVSIVLWCVKQLEYWLVYHGLADTRHRAETVGSGDWAKFIETVCSFLSYYLSLHPQKLSGGL